MRRGTKKVEHLDYYLVASFNDKKMELQRSEVS